MLVYRRVVFSFQGIHLSNRNLQWKKVILLLESLKSRRENTPLSTLSSGQLTLVICMYLGDVRTTWLHTDDDGVFWVIIRIPKPFTPNQDFHGFMPGTPGFFTLLVRCWAIQLLERCASDGWYQLFPWLYADPAEMYLGEKSSERKHTRWDAHVARVVTRS